MVLKLFREHDIVLIVHPDCRHGCRHTAVSTSLTLILDCYINRRVFVFCYLFLLSTICILFRYSWCGAYCTYTMTIMGYFIHSILMQTLGGC